VKVTRLLCVVGVALVVAATPAAGPAARAADDAATRVLPSSCPTLRPLHLRTPSRFFPSDRAGAWVPVESFTDSEPQPSSENTLAPGDLRLAVTVNRLRHVEGTEH